METNPTSSAIGEVKMEDDRFDGAAAALPLEVEMKYLVRERDLLKREVSVSERMHKYTELEKSIVEEKLQSSERRREGLEEDLRRSERRCEELEAKVQRLMQKKLKFKEKLNRSHLKYEELRQKEVKSEEKVISDCHDPVKKHLCSKGDRELVHGGTQEDGTKVEFTHIGSKSSYISDVAKSPGSVHDNDGKRVRGGRNLAITGTENDGANVDAYHDLNVAEGKGTTFRINRLCNLFKIIKDIKMNLEKENLEKFEHSCFGNLLKTNELTFQGQLIVQLLLHMDLSASNKERLVFKINNSAVEFGPCDFFHITGLRVGNLETTTRSLTTSSTIHQSVFRGTPAISLKEIEEAFLNASTSHEGKGEGTLKLALLYFVYGTLLAKTSNCKIELQYFHLIEDLQKFNAFPWGTLFHLS